MEELILHECEKRNIKLHVIGIIGKKESGKTTIANYLCTKYNYILFNYGDKVKEVCKILFNFTHEQCTLHKMKETVDNVWNITPRRAFQYIGTEFGQHQISDIFTEQYSDIYKQICNGRIWVVSLLQELYNNLILQTPYSEKGTHLKLIFGDVRFQHEIKSLSKLNTEFIFVTAKDNENDMCSIHTSEDICFDNVNENVSNVVHILNDKRKELDDLYCKIDESIDCI